MKRLHIVILIFSTIHLPITAWAADCTQAVADSRRLFGMAQEQLKTNREAAEDFLIRALGGIADCEYADSLKMDLNTALGEFYRSAGDRVKAVLHLERAITAGMNMDSPNSYPAVLLGEIYAESSQTDITAFPKAVFSYKTAIDINHFASAALARQTEEKYKQLQGQTEQKMAQLWETAKDSEAREEWEKALSCYNSLALIVPMDDKLQPLKKRAQFRFYLQQADTALSNYDADSARQALYKAKATDYFTEGHGQGEVELIQKRLLNPYDKKVPAN